MRILTIATSLNPSSRSQLLAEEFDARARERGHETELLDMRSFPIPLTGAEGSWEDPAVASLQEKIARADRVVLAVPVYVYSVNSTARGVIELGGRALTGKIVGFIASAGGARSYMSVMSLANSLMLDFRCWIAPRFVYATSDDWEEDTPVPEIQERLTELLRSLESVKVAQEE